MAANEAWVLDGVTLTSGNFDVLELNADPPKARFEWISAADSEGAALVRQPLHENRTITMRLRVSSQASMNAALDQIGAVRDKLRKASATSAGVALTWTPANSTRTVTFDVLGGEIPEVPIGISDQAWSWFKQRPIFTIEMTAMPYWRGTEALTSTASTSTPIQTLEVASVTGDVPALGRLIVTDTATQNRRYVAWGLENQYYDNTTSLYVDSDNLVTSGFTGTQTTRSGAHDPNAAGNNVIRVTPVTPNPVAVCGLGNLTHIGTYRVLARCFFATEYQRVRLTWRETDGPTAANQWAAPGITGATGFWAEVDLGLITINPAKSGTQRWTGQIETYDTQVPPGLGALDVDYLLLIPAGEGYGKSTATFTYTPGTVVARDDFNSAVAASALNARVASSGGTWATSGAATDFAALSTTSSGMVMQRVTASDAAGGRYAVLGSTNYTDIEVGVYAVRGPESWTGTDNSLFSAAIARWTNSSNFVRARVNWAGAPTLNPFSNLVIEKIVAGTVTTLAVRGVSLLGGAYYLVRLVVYASGRVIGSVVDLNGSVRGQVEALDSALATGGTLATGLIGFEDQQLDNEPVTRWYDSFYASTPNPEPIVLYSGRSMQVRYDTTIRQDSSGTYYGDLRPYHGTRFLVPPGTSRVAVATRRQNIETNPADNVTDATQIQIGVTPRGLVVPR